MRFCSGSVPQMGSWTMQWLVVCSPPLSWRTSSSSCPCTTRRRSTSGSTVLWVTLLDTQSLEWRTLRRGTTVQRSLWGELRRRGTAWTMLIMVTRLFWLNQVSVLHLHLHQMNSWLNWPQVRSWCSTDLQFYYFMFDLVPVSLCEFKSLNHKWCTKINQNIDLQWRWHHSCSFYYYLLCFLLCWQTRRTHRLIKVYTFISTGEN